MYEKKTHLILEYPHSAVLYLRHNNDTPDNMTVIIKTPGGEISYKVPVIKMQKYSLEEIFKKNLLFLIPFYIFNYEKEFPLMENGNENFQKAEKEFITIIKQLNNICLGGEISEYTKSMLLDMSNIVIESLAVKYEKIKKGIGGIMGGKVLDYEAKTIFRSGREEGMKNGMVYAYYEMNLQTNEIARKVNLTEEEVLEIIRKKDMQ